MKFLILIGFLFTLSVSFSAPVIHSGVTDKHLCFDASDSIQSFDLTIENESVDFNYSSVATLPTYNLDLEFGYLVGESKSTLKGLNPSVSTRNKGDPRIL